MGPHDRHAPREQGRRPARRVVGVVGLALVLVTAACTPLSLDRSRTESTTELGLSAPARPTATRAVARTAAAVDPVADLATGAATGAAPRTTAVVARPAAATGTARPTGAGPTSPAPRTDLGGCEVFPADNAFRARVDRLAVRPDSAAVLATAGGAATRVRPGFSAGVWQGSRGGYPVNLADSRTDPAVDYVVVAYPGISDPTGHVLPADVRFEGWPSIAWDRHVLAVDVATCTTSEAFNVSPPWANPFGRWTADSAVHFDLRSNDLPARGSATASGFSLLHGLVRYDEVATGRLGHAVTVTLPDLRAGEAVWPARFTDGRSSSPTAPQMGSWLRLRAGVDLSGLGPQARVVAEAMRTHGAVVGDTGPGGLTLTGEPDERWDDADLAGLGRLSLADFELVDPSSMQVDGSLRVR